jgi:hypothetical protein
MLNELTNSHFLAPENSAHLLLRAVILKLRSQLKLSWGNQKVGGLMAASDRSLPGSECHQFANQPLSNQINLL